MSFDVLEQVESNLNIKRVGITEFAESDEFCNKRLYPRQRVLLKLIFLEELTGEEEDVLDYWIAGGRHGNEVGISPQIRERAQYMRDIGAPHFREIVLVGGRRSSKGFVTGIAMAKVMYDALQLQDPGLHYGIDPEKEIYFSCVASAEIQAKKFQYADLVSTVENCKVFEPYMAKSLETEFGVMTPADQRKAIQMKAKNRKVQRHVAKLRGNALASNASTLRGSATMALAIDEMAHMLPGESRASAEQVYDAAEPSLDQFGQDAIIFCNPPEAPVYMADLSHKPIGEIEVGDKVVGWHLPEGKVHRELCESEVTNVMRRKAPLVKITMESGRTFRCTPDHRWLTLSSGGNKATHDGEWYAPAKAGRKLAHVIDPSPALPPELKRDAAWLAGMFDGEGHASSKQAITIGQSDIHNPKLCKEIERVLDLLGLVWTYDKYPGEGAGGCYRLIGGGGAACRQMYTNLANWLQPVRRQGIVDKVLNKGRWRTEDRVVSVEPDGEGEVVALSTSTVNYICNGYASRNCNSSPYTKVGKFFERHEEAMKLTDDGKPAAPMMFSFQFSSWALFDGYQSDRRFNKAITVSPDWDPDEKNEDGTDKWSKADKHGILIARANEAQNPDTYKVERRAKFSEVIDAYLNPDMVDRIFFGRPKIESGEITYEPLETNRGQGALNIYRYMGHLDPSSTTAGFGFALGHTERLPDPQGNLSEHVVFDIVQRWDPQNFPGGVIRWETVTDEILRLASIFRPEQITFDQFQSHSPIQQLNRDLHERNISGVRVYEKFSTNESNWKRAEIFKTAAYLGYIHAPKDTDDIDWASLELKFLQQNNTAGKYPRVDKQSIGPVQTKDMADCIMAVTEHLIGNTIARRLRDDLSTSPAMGAPGGYKIGGDSRAAQAGLTGYYQGRRQGEQLTSGLRSERGLNIPNRTRRSRPVPRKLPGW